MALRKGQGDEVEVGGSGHHLRSDQIFDVSAVAAHEEGLLAGVGLGLFGHGAEVAFDGGPNFGDVF